MMTSAFINVEIFQTIWRPTMSDNAIDYSRRSLSNDIEQRIRLSRRPLCDVTYL